MARPPRPFIVGAAVVTAVLGAVGFVPLFGGLGYEHALATGLVAPGAAAVANAVSTARGDAPSPLAAVARGVLAGLAYAALALVTAVLHALRVGACEIWGALLYFGLTAGAGAVMGGAWGAVAGELTRVLVERGRVRRLRLVAVLLALAAPLGGAIVSVYRFYSSPMIFAFDPFVGYFSGTLYDTIIDAGTPLLTYRLGSLATLSALALAASLLVRDASRPLGLVLDLRTPATRARGVLALLALFASAAVMLEGIRLGHVSTSASIAKELGGEKHGVRCDVVYPSSTRERDALLMVKDCDEQVAAVERRLGARGPARIRAFFFRDAAEKKRLMGAAHTYIAKPWREEVYLQIASYPHPILGHEIAHVIAGSFGRGPFRIAGDLGGLVPNPGLIEGVAVAASPDDQDLTDLEWARAMMQIGILPSFERVFSFGFLGANSAKSYTLAGAFVSWLGETRGMETVRRWYGGESLPTITGKSWAELDRDFRERLAKVPLPPEAESFAKARFARPGIWGRKCPHLIDALRHDADVCRDAQRFDEARALYDRVLSKDPTDFPSRLARAVTDRRHGDRDLGRSELTALATADDVPRTFRDRADEALADADFADGEFESARARYLALAERSLDEDVGRTLEVKSLATRDVEAREAIMPLLGLGDRDAQDMFAAGVALGRWDVRAPSPLASYLIGRNLLQRGFFEQATAALEAASKEPPTRRIAREILRQRAVSACATGDAPAALRVESAITGADDPFRGAPGGRRDATLRLIARCLGH